MRIQGNWSDSQEMFLEEGQVWEDKLNGEPDIFIVSVTEETTAFRTGVGDIEFQQTRGSDGFIDYLETCGYELIIPSGEKEEK